jgi:hypothetical protein
MDFLEMLADERPARGGADAGPMPFEYLRSGEARTDGNADQP